MTAAMQERLSAAVHEMTADWDENAKSELAARLNALRARKASIRRLDGPLGLLLRLNPTWHSSPALKLISDEMEYAITHPGSWLLVSMPPQEGKSRLARHAVVRALQHNPGCRIAIASYQERLARKIGEAARNIIATRGEAAGPLDILGIGVARGSAAKGDWTVAGHEGGVLSVGVGSGITGNAVDLLLVDDPLKGRQQADSELIRDALHDWWDNDADTRLGPQSSVIIIQTRWHEDDLIGRLTREDEDDPYAIEFGAALPDRALRVVNIPARSDGVTLDSLAGVPGARTKDGWLVSVRGDRSPKWARLAKTRPRVWASLYQGRPAPLEGGVFQSSWFDTWRLDQAPAGCLPPTVVVDPADNEGDGDEAGIILATAHPESGKVYILDDLSAPMTVARWARVALLTCARREAPSLAYEKSLSQLPKRIREAWTILRQQATALHRTKGDQAAARARLSRADDSSEARQQVATALIEIAGDVDKILAIPEAGPRLRPVIAKGAKQLRMQLAAPMFETGRAVLVGRFPQLEHTASIWQPGQDSPDRVDAMVHAVNLLAGGSAGSLSRTSERVPTSSTGMRSRPSTRLTRSTRR